MGVGGDARGRRGVVVVVDEAALPGLLEEERGGRGAVLGGDEAPEGGAVGLVDAAEAVLVDGGEAGGVQHDIAVEAESAAVGGRFGDGSARGRRLGEDGHRVVDVSGGAVGGGPREERAGRGQRDVLCGWRRVGVVGWGGGLHAFVDGRRGRDGHVGLGGGVRAG